MITKNNHVALTAEDKKAIEEYKSRVASSAYSSRPVNEIDNNISMATQRQRLAQKECTITADDIVIGRLAPVAIKDKELTLNDKVAGMEKDVVQLNIIISEINSRLFQPMLQNGNATPARPNGCIDDYLCSIQEELKEANVMLTNIVNKL